MLRSSQVARLIKSLSVKELALFVGGNGSQILTVSELNRAEIQLVHMV